MSVPGNVVVIALSMLDLNPRKLILMCTCLFGAYQIDVLVGTGLDEPAGDSIATDDVTIGSIVQVNEDNKLMIRVYGEQCSWLYKPKDVTLLTGAVTRLRRTFIPDDLSKDGITNAIECKAVETTHDLARGDLVRILPTATSSDLWTKKMELTLGKVGTIVAADNIVIAIRVCGGIYRYLREDVTLVNRGRFNLLKEHFKTHEPVYERGELQQSVNEDDFEKVTAIIRNAYKDVERFCEYELTTTIDDYQDKATTERYLIPLHDLFVLVEDSMLNKFDGEIEFRAILEKRISSEMIRSRMEGEIYQNRSVLQVPLVNLVLNNDQYTLETVKSAMDKGIPSVVVITTDSDTHKRQDSAMSDSKNEVKTKMLRNSNIPNDKIKMFQETYQEKLKLLTVINLSDMPKLLAGMTLDVCWEVWTSLLEWAHYDHKEDVVLKRLVCAEINRMDSYDIALTMTYFLSRNDVEVVGALVQLDVDMDSAWIEARHYKTFCDDNDGLLKRLKSKAKHTVLWVMQRVQARPVRGRYDAKEGVHEQIIDLIDFPVCPEEYRSLVKPSLKRRLEELHVDVFH
ncbi:hypothetical protein DPMN_078335 [Dreissena polymorpha]|uniref:TRPM SLOG domain-containing protein n=1 Tax=Dreissena polymorpha TaxID=45954 RepID=A0A9D3YSA5_DREPO|nr:hypothetical protein DPMN_078335 [Dreissena polymorpha]